MDSNESTTQAAATDGDNAVEQVREAVGSAWERGRQTWKDFSIQSKDAMANAQKSNEEAWEDAQRLVQKHPGKTVGIALLVGAAIGALLTFRRND